MFADLFYYFDTTWWLLRFSKDSECRVERDGVGVTDGGFERAKFAITADVGAEASGRSKDRFAGTGMHPELAGE